MRASSVAMVCCLALGTVHAAERNPLDARFIIDAGTFLMSTDTQVRLDGTATLGERGTDIDFDETFGIGDVDRFRIDAFWRFRERHGLRAAYFENNRSGSRTLDRDVTFGDQTYPVNVTARAESNTTIAQLAYEYAFMRREKYELSGSIGVHYLDLGFKVSGESGEVRREQDASTRAPMPLVGLRGLWRLTDVLYVTAEAQYFYVEFDPYSGSLMDLRASLVWQFTDHLGIGVAYDDFRFRFDIDDEDDFNGRLRWDYGGAMIFATFMF